MIRLAEEKDIKEIQKLNRELFTVLNKLHPNIYNIWSFNSDFIISIIKNIDSDYILIEENNMIIGYLFIEKRVSPSKEFKFFKKEEFAYIYEIVVLPEYRSKGFGKTLINEANIWAKKRNLSCIELNVLANNYSAVDFYEDIEFENYQLKMRKKVF